MLFETMKNQLEAGDKLLVNGDLWIVELIF